MRRAEPDDTQVHPEVEYLEELRLGERQNDDASELREGDTAQYLHTQRTNEWLDELGQRKNERMNMAYLGTKLIAYRLKWREK